MRRGATKFGHILLVLLTFVSILHGFYTSNLHRCITQSNFALNALKFDPSNFIEVAIPKPFGMSLEVVMHYLTQICPYLRIY